MNHHDTHCDCDTCVADNAISTPARPAGGVMSWRPLRADMHVSLDGKWLLLCLELTGKPEWYVAARDPRTLFVCIVPDRPFGGWI